MMTQTLCPSCGFTPIPDGAEACPACGEPFSFLPAYKRKPRSELPDRRDTEATATVMGGSLVTSAVTAHPGPAAAVFALGGLAWIGRGIALAPSHAPAWAIAAGGAELLAALLLYANRGPSKAVAQLVAVGTVACAIALDWAAPARPTPVLYAAHAFAALWMVIGEPGAVRRWTGLGVGMVFALAAAASLALPAIASGPAEDPRQELVSDAFGFRLRLPKGFRRLSPEELPRGVSFPAAQGGAAVAFGQPGAAGFLEVERGGSALIGECQGRLRALGAGGVPEPLSERAPAALGSSALVYAVILPGGTAGRLSCARLEDGRFVVLAVLAPSGDVSAATSAFDLVGAGLSLK